MKMLACELMVNALKFPQKYEGRRYKVVKGARLITRDDELFSEFTVKGGLFTNGGCHGLAVYCNTELEEIPQPVPFMEAVAAYGNGRTINCKCNGITHTYTPAYIRGNSKCGLCDENDVAVSAAEILEGVWTIEGGD
jgi:hypothetical protein